jgi:hypothetical protein
MKIKNPLVLLFACASAVAVGAQNAPLTAPQVWQQVKLLDSAWNESNRSFNDQVKAEHDKAQAQVDAVRDNESTNIKNIEKQRKASNEQFESQRERLIETVRPGYTERRKALLNQWQVLDDQMNAELSAIDIQQKKDEAALRAQYQEKRKAVLANYAQQRKRAENSTNN